MKALVVEGLVKSYGSNDVVKGMSFEVSAGEVCALLGANGAGKTTTLEILEGFRQRDAGDVQVLGRDPGLRANRRWLRDRVGLVLQSIAVEPYLTVRETMRRHAGYYPAPRSVDEVLELVGLTDQRGARVRDLSGGQQRRLDVALGVVGNPELLFLDEPTTGFDPSARRDAWDLVRNLKALGTTIVLTTHYMDEAQALADNVVVLAGGRVVAEGPPSSLGGRDTARTTIRFVAAGGIRAAELPLSGCTVDESGRAECEVLDATVALHTLTSWSLSTGTALTDLTVDRPSLEDVVLGLTDPSQLAAPVAAPRRRRSLVRSAA